MPSIRYVRTPDGVDLAYRVFDGGPAELVIAPGWINAIEVLGEWPGADRWYEGLASFSRVVEYDGRGSGLSGRSGSPPNLETRVHDLEVVMDAAGFQRPALFSAYDGAAVVSMFTATHPDRVSALVLYCPQVRTAWADDYPWGTRPEESQTYSQGLRELWSTEEPTAEQISAAGFFEADDDLDPAFRRWFARFVRHLATPAEIEAFDAVWMQTDVRDVLPAVQAPTVVLHASEGDDDRGRYSSIAAAIPGATRRELPGTHFFFPAGDVEPIVDSVAEHLQVERPAPASDRVLASVLFTDIVDSTRRAAELGDAAWKELLGAHDEVERTQLERFGGRFVHTTGDGMLATFDGPARAVHCAQAIAAAVRPVGVEIRAGVHTGEVELLRGEIQGLAVHIGARVAAKAGPSEVWVSRTVKDLVAGSGLAFEDAGEHELKGVPDTWHLYRVVSA